MIKIIGNYRKSELLEFLPDKVIFEMGRYNLPNLPFTNFAIPDASVHGCEVTKTLANIISILREEEHKFTDDNFYRYVIIYTNYRLKPYSNFVDGLEIIEDLYPDTTVIITFSHR